MRASTAFLALPALACAQQQYPLGQMPIMDQLKGWFGKASESVAYVLPSSASVPDVPNPIASGAAKIAEVNVQPLTLQNYKEVLKPGAATASPGIEEFMVYVTGGNTTCHGRCAHAEQMMNESVALISASRSPPGLAYLNCENEPVLCLAWSVRPPSVLHFLLPQPLADQSTPATTFRGIPLNRTTVTAPEIAGIHLQEKYKEREVYEGLWHPFDGPIAQNGLTVPAGYVLWAFNQIPSWLFMVSISIVSRYVMQRRMQPAEGRAQAYQ